MLVLLLGLMPPLIPAISAHHMASRQVSFSKGDMPPNKTYMFMLLVHQWMVLLTYWMLGMLVFYGVAFILLLTVRKVNTPLFDVVLEATLDPWRSRRIAFHGSIVALPIAVVMVALLVQPIQRTTRAYVEEDLKYMLLLMSLTAFVTWMLVASIK